MNEVSRVEATGIALRTRGRDLPGREELRLPRRDAQGGGSRSERIGSRSAAAPSIRSTGVSGSEGPLNRFRETRRRCRRPHCEVVQFPGSRATGRPAGCEFHGGRGQKSGSPGESPRDGGESLPSGSRSRPRSTHTRLQRARERRGGTSPLRFAASGGASPQRLGRSSSALVALSKRGGSILGESPVRETNSLVESGSRTVSSRLHLLEKRGLPQSCGGLPLPIAPLPR